MRADSNHASRQVSPAYTSEISITFEPRVGSSVSSYTESRIVRLRTAEGMYGGELFTIPLPNGSIIPVAAQIILDNSDNEFTSEDFRGHRVEIDYWFATYDDGCGEQVDAGSPATTGSTIPGPYWVMSQRDTIQEGRSVTEFWCIDAWGKLQLDTVHGSISTGSVSRFSDKTIRQVLKEVLLKNPIKVFTFDDSTSTYADITSSVADPDTTNQLPWDGDDILYIGWDDTVEPDEFIDRITIELSVAADATLNPFVQYWSGSVWTTMGSLLEDQLDGFSDNQENCVDVPKVISINDAFFSLMAKTTINGSNLMWIRFLVPSSIVTTTPPTVRTLHISRYMGLYISESDGQENDNSNKPEIVPALETTSRDLIRDVLDRTQSALVATRWNFDLRKVDKVSDTPTADYTYNAAAGDIHPFYYNIRERGLVLPNQVVAFNVPDGSNVAQFIGTIAEDTDSIDEIGVVLLAINDPTILSTAEATARASRMLERLRLEAYQGTIVAPIHVGQEPWDVVDIRDTELGLTHKARVGTLVREYDSELGIYRILLSMGLSPVNVTHPLSQYASLIREQPTEIDFARIRPTMEQPTEQSFVDFRDPALLPPEQPSLPSFQRFSTSRPNILTPNVAQEMGLPFWFGLVPQVSNYRLPKFGSPVTTTGSFHVADVDSLKFKDWQVGGYSDIEVYHNSAGFLSIAQVQGSGLDVIGVSLEPYGTGVGDTQNLVFRELVANGNNYVGFKAADTLAGNIIWVLPNADGSNGQVLSTNGSGLLSWVDNTGCGCCSFDPTNIGNDLIPDVTDTRDVGSATKVWQDIYGTDIQTANIKALSSSIDIHDDLTPAGAVDIGASGDNFANLYIDDIHDVTSISLIDGCNEVLIAVAGTTLLFTENAGTIEQVVFGGSGGIHTIVLHLDGCNDARLDISGIGDCGSASNNLLLNSNLLPTVDETFDLGTSSKAWDNAYIDEVHVDILDDNGNGDIIVQVNLDMAAGAYIDFSGNVNDSEDCVGSLDTYVKVLVGGDIRWIPVYNS